MNYQLFTPHQKQRIIAQVELSRDKQRELIKFAIPRSTYYDWKRTGGVVRKKTPKHIWNKTPEAIERAITAYRLSGDRRKNSPMRIVENLEVNDGYVMSESGVKSVLTRKNLPRLNRSRRRHYYIRKKADKFLDVVCFDDVEFIRHEPRDTYVLNFVDEASYMAVYSKVLSHRINRYDIIRALKAIRKHYGRYPKMLRCDNARAHKSIALRTFCAKHSIEIDYITKGCPEENWPVESFHRNLNQDVIYQNGFSAVARWQRTIDEYLHFHNRLKRLRSDPIQRTPHEIAFAYTTRLTQQRLKVRLQRKLHGQTSVEKFINKENFYQKSNYPYSKPFFVSEMCKA